MSFAPGTAAAPIEPLDNGCPAVAREIRRVLLAASEQEAALLGVVNRPLRASLEEIAEPGLRYFGAHDAAGLLCGWLSLEPAERASDEAYIISLVVDPDRQRRGLARALVTAALQHLAWRPLRVSTPAMNAPALALYHGSGFIEAGRVRVGPAALEVVLLRHPGHPPVP